MNVEDLAPMERETIMWLLGVDNWEDVLIFFGPKNADTVKERLEEMFPGQDVRARAAEIYMMLGAEREALQAELGMDDEKRERYLEEAREYLKSERRRELKEATGHKCIRVNYEPAPNAEPEDWATVLQEAETWEPVDMFPTTEGWKKLYRVYVDEYTKHIYLVD